MQKIRVKTGFGYYKDSLDHVIAKAELSTGEHDLADGLNYIEVSTKAELDTIKVWEDPAETEKQQNEQKIQAKIRQIAIDSLIESGELPSDYLEK